MDTRSKKSNVRTTLYVILMIVEIAAVIWVLFAGSIFAALNTMSWANGADPIESYISGIITDMAGFMRIQNFSGIGGIAGLIIAGVLFIWLAFMTGKGKKDEDGKIHLTWFDRIWSEVQIIIGIFAGIWAASVLDLLYYIWLRGQYLRIWESTTEYADYMTNELEMTYCITGLVVSCTIIIICIFSIIKKIKAGQFWEKSLLGGAILAVYRSIKGSDKTLLKVLVIFMAAAILAATWILLPVILVLILIFVPKEVKKFNAIKRGVEEVKNGNLTYKIPVEEDARGVRGEFDRMAADINEISKASSVAVQNEIKNQRMKTDLISNVSHDLKTPLTSMISYIDLLKKEGLDSPNAPEYLDIIDQKTQRLKDLTENLFEAAKASSGAIPVNMENIDLASLLSQSLAETEERLAEKGLDIQVRNECEDCRIMADGQLMWRVLENLLGNVSKYALENSRVYINMRETDALKTTGKKMIILEMKNISKAPLNISAEELMERFKRGDESRTTEGSGLGLAIAKDLTRLMNGIFEITVDGDLFKAIVMMEKV